MARATLEVIIEAQNQARRQLEQLGDQLKGLSRNQADLADSTQNSERSFLQFVTAIGAGVLAARIAERAIFATGRALKNFIGSSIETALSVERIAATLPVLAKNTGKTTEEINKIIFAIRAENKSIREATEITRGIVLAGLDEVDALQLLTVARDVGATVGRSSADTNRLILESFQTLNPGILKQIGLNISLRTTYRELAKSLGKNVESLTTIERQQGLLNAVFTEGAKFAGAYDAAMTTVQKVTNSVKDASEDIKFVLGSLLTGGFFPIVQESLNAVRAFRAWAITSENVLRPELQALGDTIGRVVLGVFRALVFIALQVGQAFIDLKNNLVELGILGGIIEVFKILGEVWNSTILPALKFLIGDGKTFRVVIQALLLGIVALIVVALVPLALAIAKATLVVVAVIAVIRILIAVFTELFFRGFQLADAIGRAWDRIKNTITTIVTAIKTFIFGGFNAIRDFLANTWESIRESAFGALEAIVAKIRDTISSITSIPRAIARSVGGAVSTARSFIGLQEGGIVTRPTTALLGEAGPEAVIPLRKLAGMGGANITVNINGAVFSDDVEALALQVGDTIIERLGLNIRIA